MKMFISRVTLSRKPSVQALNALLMPDSLGDRMDANHRLLWTLFADESDHPRDFLWRAESTGEFVVLSAREPTQSDLFSKIDSKPFAPNLIVGASLFFALRANATVSKDKQRVDVVMNRLHPLPKEERATRRMEIATTEGFAWLARKGALSGFETITCVATDYSTHALPKSKGSRQRQPQFGILELSGKIVINDPKVFVGAVNKGFGRAKAFGCGLMLLRRAK
jgi:CRISPR system Cascade subunit CasE